MGVVGRLRLPQRIVVVIALGLALGALGEYLVNLTWDQPVHGWYGYAPLTEKNTIVTYPGRPAGWEQLLIWLGLVVVWAGISLWLLRAERVAS